MKSSDDDANFLYVVEPTASLTALYWVIEVKIYSGYLFLITEDLIKYLL